MMSQAEAVADLVAELRRLADRLENTTHAPIERIESSHDRNREFQGEPARQSFSCAITYAVQRAVPK